MIPKSRSSSLRTIHLLSTSNTYSMSDPSRRLERLSINTNQPGRPGQRTHIEGAERTPSKGSDSEMEEVLARGQGASAARPSIPGRSGLIYDLTQLPLLVQKRAASSITTDFSVQTCSTTPNSFIFEVNDPPSPVSLMSSGMTCTCGEYRDDGGKACRHIFVSCFQKMYLVLSNNWSHSGCWINCTPRQ